MFMSKLGLAATMALAIGLPTTSPAAASTTSPTGQPGGVTLQRTLGVPNQTFSTIRLYSGDIHVNRSPATTGTQRITINWRVWQIYGTQWELLVSPQSTYTVYAGQYLGTKGWYYDHFGGEFAVEYRIVWQDATGRVIGTKFVDFVHAGDYQCNPGAFCSVYWRAGQYVMSVT